MCNREFFKEPYGRLEPQNEFLWVAVTSFLVACTAVLAAAAPISCYRPLLTASLPPGRLQAYVVFSEEWALVSGSKASSALLQLQISITVQGNVRLWPLAYDG